MTLDELEALVQKCRALGLTEFEDGNGVKLKIGPPPAGKPTRQNLRDSAVERKRHQLEEEMLQFASVEGFYDLDDNELSREVLTAEGEPQ